MKRFAPLIMAILCALAAPSLAQDKPEGLEDYYLDATTIEDKYSGDYERITPQSLSRLYWRLHVFDSGDNRAIDNYMLINECQIYQDNVNNDFEWNIIREAAKKSIKKDKATYPTQFEFFVPVHLGRYDVEKKGFYLVNGTGYNNVRRMEVQSYIRASEICGKDGEVKDYPKAVLFVLPRPLNYVFAEVDEHVAQAYILRKQKEVLDLPPDERQRSYERTAYLRIRVDVKEYQGNIKGKKNVLAVLQSELHGIDLFEDARGERLLSSTVMERNEDDKTNKPERVYFNE